MAAALLFLAAGAVAELRLAPFNPWLYYTSLGGVGRGAAEVVAQGLRFTGTMRASSAEQAKPFTATWRRLSADRYEVAADGKTVIYQLQADPAR